MNNNRSDNVVHILIIICQDKSINYWVCKLINWYGVLYLIKYGNNSLFSRRRCASDLFLFLRVLNQL